MKYLVAMSGGIDSSVAAVKLKKEGHEVVGVHMILWSEDIAQNKCCNTDDMSFARELADKYDFPFYSIDLSDVFKEKIVSESFLQKYECGLTPNPCVYCNQFIRFGSLIDKAKELGMEMVVTGHYAIIEETAGKFRLKVGVDKSKDQSYFLHRLSQENLSKIYFPLGEMHKFDVKKLAEEWGLINPNSAKTESQDLCFIPEKTVEPFLKRHLDKKHWTEGDMVDSSGKVLGKHRGLPFYTIGQRKGIDLGGLKEPLYVIGKNDAANQLILGKNEDGTNIATIKELNLIDPEFDQSKTYDLVTRYGGKKFRGKLKLVGETEANILFEEKVELITPGQFLVIYDGDYCLGGGEISI